jgi:hypothetical protein
MNRGIVRAARGAKVPPHFIRIWLCVFSLSIGIHQAAAGPAENLESLLDRLESACAAFGKPEPKKYHAVGTVLNMDSDWKPETVTRIEKEITVQDSIRHETIVRAVRSEKNGKEVDITRETIESDRRNGKDGKGKGRSYSMSGDDLFVFDRQRRAEYDFTRMSDSLADGKRVARLIAVPRKKAVERFRMTYLVDPDSMTVLGVEMSPSRNPKMVKQLAMSLRLSRDSEGHYFLGRFWMRIYVNLLVKKIRTEYSEEYSGFEY